MSQKRIKKRRKLEEVISGERVVMYGETVVGIIKKHWLFLILIFGLIVGVYANGMRGDFVSDDYASITQYPKIGDFWHMMTKDGGFAHSSYITNSLIYLMFGNSKSTPYHIFNLICYLVFIALAFAFLMILLQDEKLSKITILLFAVHPIHVEAVTWISGRIYLFLATYAILSLICFMMYIKKGNKKYLWLMFLFFVLAFQTDKPRPFVLMFLIPAYLVFEGLGRLKDKLRNIIYGMLVATVLFILVAIPYINTRISTVNSGYNSSGSVFYDPFFQYPIAVTKYLQLLWFPVDLTLYHTMYFLPGWVNWMVIILYLAMLVYFFIKDKRYFFALFFIFGATFPSMSPIKVSWLVAERYMFLGSLGFCLLMGLILKSILEKSRYIGYTIILTLVVVYSVRIVYRNNDWNTNHNLWVNTCQVSPNSHNAWNNIGDDYDKLKDYASAVKGFTQSTIVKPNYADAYHNRANIFYKIGRLDLARESYDVALRFSPTLYQTYISLVQIDLMEKKYDLALQHASQAVEIDANNPQSMYILAVAYAQSGNVDEAKKILRILIQRFPEFTMAANALTELERSVGTS